jgi:tyramine---L-glutamate ligase
VRIFVCEFVTGGGLYGAPLPPSLVREGDLMVRSLARDLLDADMEVLLAREPRLGPIDLPVQTLAPSGTGAVWADWARAMRMADAVWPIAPESGGALERLSALVQDSGRLLLGCRPEAIRVTASKLATARCLAAAGVTVAPTTCLAQGPAGDVEAGDWVVKPDDGVGCEETLRLRRPGVAQRLAQLRPGFVMQPYIEGCAASLSLLCCEGEARLLSANRQLVDLEGEALRFRGCEVNALDARDPALRRVAEGVAASVPGLWGYVGVDLVVRPSASPPRGPAESAEGAVVLEVNPRLTISYAGLRAALGQNPAEWVLNLAASGLPDTAATPGRVVRLELEACRAV